MIVSAALRAVPSWDASRKSFSFGDGQHGRDANLGDQLNCPQGEAKPVWRRKNVPKCKNTCPQRLNSGLRIHLSSSAMSSLSAPPRRKPKMRSHSASQSFVVAMAVPPSALLARAPRRHDRMGFIGLVAGWSSALVLILALSAFLRFVG